MIHLDQNRIDELCQDLGEEIMMDLMQDFLDHDYESPLNNIRELEHNKRRDILHALKGISCNIGALTLFLLSRDLMKQTDLTITDELHIIEILRETRNDMMQWIDDAKTSRNQAQVG